MSISTTLNNRFLQWITILLLLQKIVALSSGGSWNSRLTSTRDRRSFLTSGASAAATATAAVAPITSSVSSPAFAEERTEGVLVYKLPSGLQYIILKEGMESSPTPQYGQLCSINYKAYVKILDKDKKEYDKGRFLIKHGNRRTIAGLDEGLHTMKVGERRRIIIPPKLGFVENGLGPLPSSTFDRWKLQRLLDDLVAARKGNLIYDVDLLNIMDDEADLGYYQDDQLTNEEVEEIVKRLRQGAQDPFTKERPEGVGDA